MTMIVRNNTLAVGPAQCNSYSLTLREEPVDDGMPLPFEMLRVVRDLVAPGQKSVCL